MAVPAFRLSTSKVPLDDLFCVLFLSLSMIAVRLSLRRRAVGHFQSCRPWVYCNGVSFCFSVFFAVVSLLWKTPLWAHSCVVHTRGRARLWYVYGKWRCSVIRRGDLQLPTVLQRDDVTFHSQKLFLSLSIVLPPCQSMILLAFFPASFFMLPNLGIVVAVSLCLPCVPMNAKEIEHFLVCVWSLGFPFREDPVRVLFPFSVGGTCPVVSQMLFQVASSLEMVQGDP